MRRECKEKRQAVVISILIHLVVFVLIAWTGLFMRMDRDVLKVIDVSVYEAGGSASGGGGSDGGAIEQAKAPSMDDIVVSKPVDMTQNLEQYMTMPEKQQEYNEAQHNKPVSINNESNYTASNNAANNNNSGQGSGKGGGQGTGDSSGIGSGNGIGSGTGSGDGVGNGTGKRPKTAPNLLAAVTPEYPASLRRAGIEGSVSIKMLVDENGNVSSAQVVSSSDYDEFDSAAVEAAYKYRFSPAKNAYGEPVRCYIHRTFCFDLS